VIIDLLPAYFSGESSAATRALVEEYFREHPDFESTARAANRPLEDLKVPFMALDEAKEKLALERARQITEARSAFLWLAIFFTLILLLFRIRDHQVVWIMWQATPILGLVFTLMAGFFWLLYLTVRRRKEPLPRHTTFLWLAGFYTVLLFLPAIRDHQLGLFFFGANSDAGVLFAVVATVLWVSYFYQRWKAKSS
jgi:hypothetical protein